ncbi:MAG: metallophosphoesterase family protein [Candidatus Riflebacteria bacterium]|nr:metallophosphoesterase family protein [Candidatus Riflebacteria bacterium]
MLDPNRDIFVISDLHLGDHGKRDNFFLSGKDKNGKTVERLKLFEDFLEMVKKNNGQLVILGDLFEFWQANIGEVIRINLPILDKLAEMKAVFVVGNHDIDFEPLVEERENVFKHPFFSSMTSSFIMNIGGKRFKFFHGHEVDPYNQGNSPAWGRMMAIFAGIAEDKFGVKFNDQLTMEDFLSKTGEGLKAGLMSFWEGIGEKWDHLIGNDHKNGLTPAQNKSLVGEHFEHMENEKKKNEFDIAICGHTHMAGKFEDWYVNSGSWVNFRNGEPVGNFIWIHPDGQLDVCVCLNDKFDYIESKFVRSTDTGLVANFDFENNCPIA